MLLLRLWNYVRGYVIILVEGYFLEKFINICTHRQILLWDVKRQKNSSMMLKVSIRGFKLLRPVARKTGCRVRIVKKKGLPFILNRYRKRKFFLLGAITFVFIFFILSSFIWDVDIAGNTKLEKQFLIDKLESFGVKPGILKYSVDTNRLVNDMMLEVSDIGWIGIVVKGTRVKVKVSERKKPPEILRQDVPCDIVALRDGIIKSLIVKEGQEMVKVGETITKGQILVSGTVKNKNPEKVPRIVHAMGEVTARTWYEGRCVVSTKIEEKSRTGNIKNNYSLVLFSRNINLFHREVAYQDFEKVEISKKASLGENFVLPFEIRIARYYENEAYEREISEDEARQLAADKAYKEAKDAIPEDAQIVKTDIQFKDNEGIFEANAVLECIENIGISQVIN